MDLNNQISFFITNVMEVGYYSHKNYKSNFTSFNDFIKKFEKKFNNEYFQQKFPVYFDIDIKQVKSSHTDDQMEQYYHDLNQIKKLLFAFYPILKVTSAPDDDDDTDTIIHSMVTPYLRQSYTQV